MICQYCRGGSHGSCINNYEYSAHGEARTKRTMPINSCYCQHKFDRPWVSKHAVPQPEGAR